MFMLCAIDDVPVSYLIVHKKNVNPFVDLIALQFCGLRIC